MAFKSEGGVRSWMPSSSLRLPQKLRRIHGCQSVSKLVCYLGRPWTSARTRPRIQTITLAQAWVPVATVEASDRRKEDRRQERTRRM
eukprot:1145705-Pyramimonas_sp.AAC.1